jgi:hypothetical protein
MQSKGWEVNAVDRTKLRSLQAKLFLTKADNVTDNNMGKSPDMHGEAGMESSHGHGHDSMRSTPVHSFFLISFYTPFPCRWVLTCGRNCHADDGDDEHGNGHGHGHGHGHSGFTIQTAIDSLILLSCFYLALYTLFMYYAISIWSDWGTWTKAWMHILVIAPALINLGWIGPAALKAAAVVHGIQDIDEDAIISVLDKMNTTIEAKAQLREALRHEYGVDLPHPERENWCDRFKDVTADGLGQSSTEAIRFGTWFKEREESVQFFHKVADAKTEADLKQLLESDMRKTHIRLEKDDDHTYFKHYPQTPCPPSNSAGPVESGEHHRAPVSSLLLSFHVASPAGCLHTRVACVASQTYSTASGICSLLMRLRG